jgi:predicted SprT family Zn-dependent metalloprotease
VLAVKIPNKFKLLGQTITVAFPHERFTDTDGEYGFASYRKNEIQLRPSSPMLPLSEEQIAQTFWHELTHFVLYHAGAAYSGKSDYMHQDEGFVDLVGSLLHQAVSTFEFEAHPAITDSTSRHG